MPDPLLRHVVEVKTMVAFGLNIRLFWDRTGPCALHVSCGRVQGILELSLKYFGMVDFVMESPQEWTCFDIDVST